MKDTKLSAMVNSSAQSDVLTRRDFLKLVLAGAITIPLASCDSSEITLKPNIVVIFADDIGPGDIGFYHQERTGNPPVIPTPNIDQMILDGMRFSDAHAPNSLCAPSRFSMLTGNYSFRGEKPFGAWRPWNNPGIEPKFTTSARIAREAGYTTSFFGKWGCGGQIKEKDTDQYFSSGDEESISKADFTRLYQSANYFGFDYALELPVGIQNFPYAFYENSMWMPLEADSKLEIIDAEQHKNPDRKTGIGDSNWDPTQVGPILASRAVAYIKKQITDNPDQPFFMFYSAQAVHAPHTPPVDLDGIQIAGSTPSAHGDMVHELDTQVGMITKALKATGVYENTLLVFSSDNGGLGPKITGLKDFGHDASHGLRGYKGQIYEGGDRVPFIAVWPNTIRPFCEVEEMVVGHDMVATIAAITAQKMPRNVVMDSLNLLPLFFEEQTSQGHEIILQQSQNGPYYAIRNNNWKLILLAPDKSSESVKDAKPVALFDLLNNPLEDENYNLIDSEEHRPLIYELFDEYLEIREKNIATVIN